MPTPMGHDELSTDVDIAIIGGGSSGITLASLLDNCTAVVFEPLSPEARDCTWSLWADKEYLSEFHAPIKGQWKQWRVVDHCKQVNHISAQYSYISVSSSQYIKYCESRLAEDIRVVRSHASNFSFQRSVTSFVAAGKSYRAKKIYDSRQEKIQDGALRQHFLGWEITTKKPITDMHIATLMDFRVDQSRGLHFIYALPFSSHKLLVESTMISTAPEERAWYQKAITDWLRLQEIEMVELLHEEFGVIPMTKQSNHHQFLPKIGVASGAIRLSSGYAFSLIQSQIKELVQRISRKDYSVPMPVSPQLAWMDMVFNKVLLENPSLGVQLMMSVAKALDGNGFARFMLGRASILDWFKVITYLPKTKFIKAAFYI
ncbi:MAG: lycopene cyclase family protein [Porticoccaceae bacterium]